MGNLTPEQLDEIRRATARAKAVLKPGDRICTRRCGGGLHTYTFAGWDGDWITTKGGTDDISARNIVKLNGEAVRFGDPLTAKDHFGPMHHQLYKKAFEALHAFAQATAAQPGANIVDHFAWHLRQFDRALREDRQATRFGDPPAEPQP